jgi:hypothetical protein
MFKFPEPDRSAEIAAEAEQQAKTQALEGFKALIPTIAGLIAPPDAPILAPHEIRAIVGDAHNAFTLGAEFVPPTDRPLTIGELLWPLYSQISFDELIGPLLNLRSELEIAAIDKAEDNALNASQHWLQDALACPNCGEKWAKHGFWRDAWNRQNLHCTCGATFELQGSLRAS